MPPFLSRIFGSPTQRQLKRLQPYLDKVNACEPAMQALTDDELFAKTADFKRRLRGGETLDDLLPEAFAAVREVTKRKLNKRHYDVQIVAGRVLHEGKIAEMLTGEGKTQVAALPLYLNALAGRGAHLVTPNDYLARIGGGWMGPIYHALDVSVSVIFSEFSGLYDPTFEDPAGHVDDRLNHWRPVTRAEAYAADITYGVTSEFGFDYLRDNLATNATSKVQRTLAFAIVDEVDNILIDEARTPLIISQPAEEPTELYYQFARVMKTLRPDEDYVVDERTKAVMLADSGIDRIEQSLKIDNLYDERNFWQARMAEAALKAQVLKRRDRDYVIRNGEDIIVDEFTGRMMAGRRWSEGLHQAVEAKEGVTIQRENLTVATITLQNLFRMYTKLAGMTGTAATEAEEFGQIYGLEVVSVPTHRPMIRTDLPDLVFKTHDAKVRAVVEDIWEMHQIGRPVLVGTVSIEKSEQLSSMLDSRQVPHRVLNAKFHEQEAAIIADAGMHGAVTIATNMAGRGTDIVLGPGIAAAGGLHVIGTERHEARRIDNQLRGRSGRQGDPGSSRFYVSLEDDLMRRFGSERIASIMNFLNMAEDEAIEHGTVTRAIEGAQVKVEGYNFDVRKHLVEYDNVMNEHRSYIYADRDRILRGDEMRSYVLGLVEKYIDNAIDSTLTDPMSEDWDTDSLLKDLGGVFPVPAALTADELRLHSRDEVHELLKTAALDEYTRREERLGPEVMREVERQIVLWTVTRLWIEHLTIMDELREGIGLRAYGQRDPLVEYKREAHTQFERLVSAINSQIAHMVFVNVTITPPQQQPANLTTNQSEFDAGASSTGTESVGEAGAGEVQPDDPCPCGSGRKYKNCHGVPVQRQPAPNGQHTMQARTRAPATASEATDKRQRGVGGPVKHTTRRSGSRKR